MQDLDPCLARCPLAVSPRYADPWYTYYYDGTQVLHLTNPGLWWSIWEPGSPWRGQRMWATHWHLTHRTSWPRRRRHLVWDLTHRIVPWRKR